MRASSFALVANNEHIDKRDIEPKLQRMNKIAGQHHAETHQQIQIATRLTHKVRFARQRGVCRFRNFW